ncbi:MAG: 50S ribosomal protein L15 [Lentisphaerae bacterium GWF2_52_8]|nr:MAG: 50S ribosomal protein L15 [Lentisphaerae bacterium GWF2_52_8]
MKLHDLHPTPGTRHPRKRVGRGDGSGQGGTAGRGNKGDKARSGAHIRPYFEGGQIPLFRRLPKHGFKNPNHKFYALINVSVIEKYFAANDVVDIEVLKTKGLVSKNETELKVLANGEISKSVTVKACKFSAAAKAKIEAAGGKCEAAV